MTVKELYESLAKLIEQGKGHYMINIQYLEDRIDDLYCENLDTLSIDDKHTSVCLEGA